MSRILLLVVLLAGLTAAAFSQPSGQLPKEKTPQGNAPQEKAEIKTDKKAADKQPADKEATPAARSAVETLISIVDFQGLDDPKETLAGLLEKLAKRYHINFDVNERAFKREGLSEVLKTEVANPPLPPMRLTFGKVLARILARVPVPSGAAFLVREDCIEITTGEVQLAEIRNTRRDRNELAKAAPIPSGKSETAKGNALKDEDDSSDYDKSRIYASIVSVSVERQPLTEALRQAKMQANYSIVLDPNLGDKSRALISATLLNAPFDSAVRVLTELADLDAVWLDNIFYITMPDRAKQLRATWPARRSGGAVTITGATLGTAGM